MLKNKAFPIVLVLLLSLSCGQDNKTEVNLSQEAHGQIFQYSLFTALANKVYDGDFTVGELKKHGDTGLGTYNGLNGEMIVENGKVYQFLENGIIRETDDFDTIPFAVVSFFEIDQEIMVTNKVNYDGLKQIILGKLTSMNTPCTIKIIGIFKQIKCGGASMQEKPYSKNLSDALADRPLFEGENVKGTMVGFWFPEYVGKINVTGFHLHLISDELDFAGHVIDFSSERLKIQLDYATGLQLHLPGNNDFLNAEFDLSEGYN